jgi:hypothetical protein
LLELAKKLNTFLVITDREINKVTDRDLKDIWLLVHNYGTDLIMKRQELKGPIQAPTFKFPSDN